MKTTRAFMSRKISAKTKGLLTFLLLSVFLISCEKNINNGSTATTSPEDKMANKQFASLQNDDASVATDWYNLQLRIILHANPAISNAVVSRMFSYEGISLFEAARFEIQNSKSLSSQLYQMPQMPMPQAGKKYSWVVSANAALASIARDFFPIAVLTPANVASIDSLEKAYNDKYTSMVGADAVANSQAFGKSITDAIFGWSKTDLFNHAAGPYTPPVFPGAWVPTPPAFAAAAAPYLGNCRTFLYKHMQGVTIPPPFPYSTDMHSGYYKMVNNDYKISKTLTTDQRNTALFWDDLGVNVGYTPMGHNISIITQIIHNSNASLATAEKAYVKAGMAMWDASIVCWRSKYTYNQQRPITYIRQNIDATWSPVIVTPNHPEYPAAHAFLTSAVMQTLRAVFGTKYPFTDHTYDFLGYPSRSYYNFNQVAIEVGESRVYGGIHYQQSVDIGHLYGDNIGKDINEISANLLNIKITKAIVNINCLCCNEVCSLVIN